MSDAREYYRKGMQSTTSENLNTAAVGGEINAV